MQQLKTKRERERDVFTGFYLCIIYCWFSFFLFSDLSFRDKWRTTLLVQLIEQVIRLVQEVILIFMKNNLIMPMNDRLVDKVMVVIVDEVLGWVNIWRKTHVLFFAHRKVCQITYVKSEIELKITLSEEINDANESTWSSAGYLVNNIWEESSTLCTISLSPVMKITLRHYFHWNSIYAIETHFQHNFTRISIKMSHNLIDLSFHIYSIGINTSFYDFIIRTKLIWRHSINHLKDLL